MEIPRKTTMQELTEKIRAIEGTEEIFDKLYRKRLDGLQLDELITGCEILGAEPVGYPLTNGVILYLKKPDGCKLVLNLDHYPEGYREPNANDLEIEVAEI